MDREPASGKGGPFHTLVASTVIALGEDSPRLSPCRWRNFQFPARSGPLDAAAWPYADCSGRAVPAAAAGQRAWLGRTKVAGPEERTALVIAGSHLRKSWNELTPGYHCSDPDGRGASVVDRPRHGRAVDADRNGGDACGHRRRVAGSECWMALTPPQRVP